ncbi:DEP domain-containing protein 1B [Chelonia mydas]|uniref:DEP domain-containing protein 1B n=1 Tax=Chelonia mydas TaxID=8469 RepID=M7BZV0_CHEMY|nr:DEP domain-containing protein 1B [Chelonia mydas]
MSSVMSDLMFRIAKAENLSWLIVLKESPWRAGRFVYLLHPQVRLIAAPSGCGLLLQANGMGAAGSGGQYVPWPVLLPAAPIDLEQRTVAIGSCDQPNLRMQQWNQTIELFREGMPLRRHRSLFKNYECCFKASEAVDWLHKLLRCNQNFGPEVTRNQTIQLLKKFLKNRVIEDIKGRWGKEDFEDDSHLYRTFHLKKPCLTVLLHSINGINCPIRIVLFTAAVKGADRGAAQLLHASSSSGVTVAPPTMPPALPRSGVSCLGSELQGSPGNCSGERSIMCSSSGAAVPPWALPPALSSGRAAYRPRTEDARHSRVEGLGAVQQLHVLLLQCLSSTAYRLQISYWFPPSSPLKPYPTRPPYRKEVIKFPDWNVPEAGTSQEHIPVKPLMMNSEMWFKRHSIAIGEVPACRLVHRQELTQANIEEIWKSMTLSHLQKDLGLDSLDEVLDTKLVNPKHIIHNVYNVNKQGVVILEDKTIIVVFEHLHIFLIAYSVVVVFIQVLQIQENHVSCSNKGHFNCTELCRIHAASREMAETKKRCVGLWKFFFLKGCINRESGIDGNFCAAFRAGRLESGSCWLGAQLRRQHCLQQQQQRRRPSCSDLKQPTYLGFERDVFKTIADYYGQMKEPLLTFHLFDVFVSVLGLLQKNKKAIEALRVSCLLLPPENRKKLQLLMKMMARISLNKDLPPLCDSAGTRTLMVQAFSRCILCSKDEVDLDELLAAKLVTFLMDNCQEILNVPSSLQTVIEEHVIHLRRVQIKYADADTDTTLPAPSFCRQISTDEFEYQRVNGSQEPLAALLEEITMNKEISVKDKKKKLKQFRVANYSALLAKYDYDNYGKLAQFTSELPEEKQTQFQAIVTEGQLIFKTALKAALDTAARMTTTAVVMHRASWLQASDTKRTPDKSRGFTFRPGTTLLSEDG